MYDDLPLYIEWNGVAIFHTISQICSSYVL